MIKTQVAFLEGRLLSSQLEQSEVFKKPWLAEKSRLSKKGAFWRAGFYPANQSEQFKKYSKISDWLENSWPSKKASFVLIM